MKLNFIPNFKWAFLVIMFIPFLSQGESHKVHEIEANVKALSEKVTAIDKRSTEHFNQLNGSNVKLYETTVNSIKATSQAAIDSSNKSIETIKYVIYLGVSIISLLVGFGVFFGYKDRKNLLEEHTKYVEESKAKIDELSKATENVMSKVPAHCVDLALLKNELKEYAEKYVESGSVKHAYINNDVRQRDKENLLHISRTAVTVAKDISDFRSISWIYSEMALLHYYDGRYNDALLLQEMAADPKYNLILAVDRFYNLSCYASCLYDVTRKQAHLKKAKDAFQAVLEIDSDKAQQLRIDRDMRAVIPHLD